MFIDLDGIQINLDHVKKVAHSDWRGEDVEQRRVTVYYISAPAPVEGGCLNHQTRK